MNRWMLVCSYGVLSSPDGYRDRRKSPAAIRASHNFAAATTMALHLHIGRPTSSDSAAAKQKKKEKRERKKKKNPSMLSITNHPPPHPTPLPHHPPSPIANQSNQEIQSLWFIRQYSSIFLDMEAAAGDSFSSLPPISGHFSHQVK